MTSVHQSTWRGVLSALMAVALCTSTALSSQGQSPGAVIRDNDDGVKYARGQNVVPVFEGWVPNPDGTFSLVFGYFNRNWEESLSIPIGPNNQIEPGGSDQGQPTFFSPRRGKNLFEIVVPRDFGKKEIVWTIVSRGRTEKAFGALVPQEVLTRRMVQAGGSLAAAASTGNDDTGDEADPNKPPNVTISPVTGASVARPLTLSATLTDDAVSPARGRPGTLRVAWSVFRGPASVVFEPKQSELPDPTRGIATTSAAFRRPGSYTIRATATDNGGLATSRDIAIDVK